jgi:flavin reductase (DIM6/NTAB) family NADH-FMN oxidoreductase RutF
VKLKAPYLITQLTYQACVVPRPIGWISTLSPTGVANLAPYSQFNNLTFDPPYVMFAANQTPTATQKDTTRNVEATGVFCWQLATYELREFVNSTAEQLDPNMDEFEHVGLEKEDASLNHVLVQGRNMPVPMVKGSPVKFECTYYTTIRLPGNPPMGAVDVVIGRVIGIHIDESVLTDGRIDIGKTVPIARCGYFEYAAINETFEMRIPGDEATRIGLEGNAKRNKAIQKSSAQGEPQGTAELIGTDTKDVEEL